MNNLTTPVRYHVLVVLALPPLATWLLVWQLGPLAASLPALHFWLLPMELVTLGLVWIATGRPRQFFRLWFWQDREPPYLLLRRTLRYTLILGAITLAYPYVWQRYAPLPPVLALGGWQFWVYYIAIGTWLSALAHQLVWRGYALDELKRITGSAGLSIVISCASYVLFYYPMSPYLAVLAGVQGLFYCMAWLRTRHLGSIVLAHGLCSLLLWAVEALR